MAKLKTGRDKTLEQLENKRWGEPEYSSHLVITCHALRKKPLADFNAEDLRIMIGQQIGLQYLVPIALEKLSEDILIAGDFYEGDLLRNILDVKPDYWNDHKAELQLICALFEKNREMLETTDTLEKIRKEWFAFYEILKTL